MRTETPGRDAVGHERAHQRSGTRAANRATHFDEKCDSTNSLNNSLDHALNAEPAPISHRRPRVDSLDHSLINSLAASVSLIVSLVVSLATASWLTAAMPSCKTQSPHFVAVGVARSSPEATADFWHTTDRLGAWVFRRSTR
jgi:hypothetical protein